MQLIRHPIERQETLYGRIFVFGKEIICTGEENFFDVIMSIRKQSDLSLHKEELNYNDKYLASSKELRF